MLMVGNDLEGEWQRQGATLSDKTACKEYGLSQPEILAAIRDCKLQHRVNSAHGNPYLRLLRREVEALVVEQRGSDYLEHRSTQAELAQINLKLKQLKAEISTLEKRKRELSAGLAVHPPTSRPCA